MKTLISKPAKPSSSKRFKSNTQTYICVFMLLLLSFTFQGSQLLPQSHKFNNDEQGKKRLDILEKLESGKSITTEDIRASNGQSSISDHFRQDFIFPEVPPIPDIPPLPEMHSFPGSFHYRYHDGRDHVIISDQYLKEIHKHLNDSMEELRMEIESFRNSEDFLIIHDELKKWNDDFRKELDKMKEEFIKSEKEARSKGLSDIMF